MARPLLPFTLSVLLLASLSSSDAAGPTAAKLPRCLQTMTKRSRLAPYVDYLRARPNVLRAFNPCQLQPSVLGWFLTKLEEAESSGSPPAAPVPQAYLAMDPNTTYVPVTAAEAYEIMGAKLARIFFVEVRRRVPWSIAAYGDADLATLFNVCESFAAGCSLRSYGAAMEYVVDHSPRVVWDVVRAQLDPATLVDPQRAMVELVKRTRTFRHGGRDLDPYLGAVTIDVMTAERVARSGCQSMAAYLVAVGAALNIPGTTIRGYYEGTGHRSALFHATDQVLAHGDDVYFGNVPSAYLLDSFTRWATEVLAYRPYEGLDSPAGFNSQKHRREVLRLFPSAWTMSAYCGLNPSVAGSGRTYLEASFRGYATAEQITDLETRILAKTASCSVIPPDDPEAQVAPAACATCPAAALVGDAAPSPGTCTTAADCADGDPCNTDGCVEGACTHAAATGHAGAVCELDRFTADLCGSEPVDARLARVIRARMAGVGRKLRAADDADASGVRLEAAVRILRGLERRVERAVRRSTITPACGTAIDDRLRGLAETIAGIVR
jgi:hypothetical protein